MTPPQTVQAFLKAGLVTLLSVAASRFTATFSTTQTIQTSGFVNPLQYDIIEALKGQQTMDKSFIIE